MWVGDWMSNWYDGDTEILTSHGFVRVAAISQRDRIAIISKDTPTIRFANSVGTQRKKIDISDFYELKRVTEKNDLFCRIPKDNMVAWCNTYPGNLKSSNIEFRKLNEIPKTYLSRILDANFHEIVDPDFYIGHHKSINDFNSHLSSFEQLLVAVQADGHVYANRRGDWRAVLNFTKPRKIERLEGIMDFFTEEFPEILWEFFYEDPRARFTVHSDFRICKRFNEWLSLDRGQSWLRDFLFEVLHWDSHVIGKNSFSFSNCNEDDVDLVMAACTLCGYHCSKTYTLPPNTNSSVCYNIHCSYKNAVTSHTLSLQESQSLNKGPDFDKVNVFQVIMRNKSETDSIKFFRYKKRYIFAAK